MDEGKGTRERERESDKIYTDSYSELNTKHHCVVGTC